jgi:hypothetical protein
MQGQAHLQGETACLPALDALDIELVDQVSFPMACGCSARYRNIINASDSFYLSCATRTSYKSLANEWEEHLAINTSLLRVNLSSRQSCTFQCGQYRLCTLNHFYRLVFITRL